MSELIFDRQRLEHDGVLSVAYQEPSAGPNAPSAFRVADFRIRPAHEPAPKATEPEATIRFDVHGDAVDPTTARSAASTCPAPST